MPRIYLDPVDNRWRIKGQEQHSFSTELDAETAHDYAIDMISDEMSRETRQRRAAERAKETT